MTKRAALLLAALLLVPGALALAKGPKPVKRVKATVTLPEGAWTLRIGLAKRTIVRSGESRTVRIVVPGRKRPRSWRLDGGTCRVTSARRAGRTLKLAVACSRPAGQPTPTPGPGPEVTATPTATASPAPSVPSAPRPVTPYVDMTLGAPANPPDLAAAKAQTGIPATTLGFITALGDQCKGAWGGEDVTATSTTFANALRERLQAFRAAGGEVVLAFGGLSGYDLAQKCATAAATKNAYKQAIDAVSAQFGAPITHIDLDVEHNAGAFSSDTAAITRQSQAIAALQAEDPELVVTYTIQAVPTRKHDDYAGHMMPVAKAAVKNAVDNGVDVAAVNAMAMDYGSWYSDGDEMGKDAISVAQTVRKSLGDIYPGRTDARLWRMVGITLMIGRNDIVNEVTTPADVAEVVAFARTKSFALVGMWSTSRDKPCTTEDASVAQPTCHSISGPSAPPAWTFGRELAKFGQQR